MYSLARLDNTLEKHKINRYFRVKLKRQGNHVRAIATL